MKIIYIVLKGMPLGGGIEKYTEEIGSRLAQRGHEVIVYTMRHYGARDGVYRGMSIKTVPTFRFRSLEKLAASFAATLFQCREAGTDIVHYHAFGPSIFCIIPKLLGKRIVVQGHGLEWKRSKWGIMGRLFLKMAEFPSVMLPHELTVVSRVQQAYIRSTYHRDSVYIPTGVNRPTMTAPDLIMQYGLKGNDYILFAARLVREKGAHYLLDAYKRLQTDMKLVIAGDAEHEDMYKAELHRIADRSDKVIFTGYVTGKLLHELYSNCHLFVLPSEIEGLPTVLFEAMSYGNCCLVSDIPENLEALNGLGYTFRNKDVPDLTAKLDHLLHDDDAVKMFKEQARTYALTDHLWDSIADRFEALYKNMCT